MGRAPCCDKANVKKGPWSPEEDAKLKEFIDKFGTGGNWIALPQKAGLKRCGKSCRLRWLNYLRPNIKHGEFTDEEDRIICTLYASIGSRLAIISLSHIFLGQISYGTKNDHNNNNNVKNEELGFLNQGLMMHPNGFEESHKFMLQNYGDDHHHQEVVNGFVDQNVINSQLEYDIEEVKQLIISSTGNGGCSNNLLFNDDDQSKTSERGSMYFY
ncbi:hypothetical protein BUALT_Bualt02G0039300 [Buddleja alternifolia]|uniref:Uncharacterized protein n=1 Tax=Buddleja alternifolia TaxID=168488 RepID=A0AAV6Y3P5_9LAMI|nr:hypothetical protein BUALT_Bualt02G0039300 [Buddleja alternifolia]